MQSDVIEFEGQCDYCPALVPFSRVTHEGGFWSMAAMESGAGSDYLAIWCHECGPKHRDGNRFFQGAKK